MVFLTLNIDFVLANSADSDEMRWADLNHSPLCTYVYFASLHFYRKVPVMGFVNIHCSFRSARESSSSRA